MTRIRANAFTDVERSRSNLDRDGASPAFELAGSLEEAVIRDSEECGFQDKDVAPRVQVTHSQLRPDGPKRGGGGPTVSRWPDISVGLEEWQVRPAGMNSPIYFRADRPEAGSSVQ
jgi:hypothetical protein